MNLKNLSQLPDFPDSYQDDEHQVSRNICHLSLSKIKQINAVDALFTGLNNERSLCLESRLNIRQFGNATGFQDPQRPHDAYYNRVVGFSETDLPYLDTILAWYRQNTLPCHFSLSPYLQTETLLKNLKERDVTYYGFDSIFTRIPHAMPTRAPNGIQIEVVTEETVEMLFALMERNHWPITPELCIQNRHYYTRPDFKFFVARVEGIPAAMGSVFLSNTLGWLSNAGTGEEFRGRGCQQALLNARIDAAAKAGCTMMVTDAEFGSVSHRNILRSGFQLAYMTAELRMASTSA